MSSEPLHVVVVAHPLSAESQKLARQIYRWLTRDPDHPTARGLGVPVTFVRVCGTADVPQTIELGVARRTVVVALVSDELMLDPAWSRVVVEADRAIATPPDLHLLIPVALSRHAPKLPGLKNQQFVVLRSSDPAIREADVQAAVLHAMSRHLLDRKPAGDSTRVAKAPVRVFVSHAKRDGVEIAECLLKTLETMGLSHFFDARDIAPGHCFESEIEGYLLDSAVVAIATDAFGGRHWCQREVLAAKRGNRPLVVVDAIRRGADRGFPYVGNAPVVRWDPDHAADEDTARRVVTLMIHETLRTQVATSQLQHLVDLGLVEASATLVPRPPELLTLPTESQAESQVLVHPDPPLGAHELHVLTARRPSLAIATPTTLRSGSAIVPDLNRLCVALSISNPPAPDLACRGLSSLHVDDLWVELGRWLLATGASLAYGGDLRRSGHTEVLFDLMSSRRDEGLQSAPLHSWLAWPLHTELKPENETEWIGMVEFHKVPLAKSDKSSLGDGSQPDHPLADRFARVRNLELMRRSMADCVHARVVVGGQLRGLGPYPGVAEEARLAIERKQPTFILGGLGGCAQEVAELIAGGAAASLTREFQSDGEGRGAFLQYYDSVVDPCERTDFERLRSTFKIAGWAGLRNGLSDEENRQLAVSASLPELVALILKGLRATLGAK